MKESCTLTETFDAKPSEIYHAWLDSDGHTRMTGGAAEGSKEVGEAFTAWDGYITGTNVDLIPGEKIVQIWRTTEFSEDDEDSILTIQLREVSEGSTELTLIHTNIPEGQTQYEQGWIDHYFIPMKEYFGE